MTPPGAMPGETGSEVDDRPRPRRQGALGGLWQYDVPALADLPDTHLSLDEPAERAERQARQDALDQARRAWLTLHPVARRAPRP